MLGLTAIWAAASGIFGGLGRWLNPDAWKGMIWAVAVIVVVGGLTYWHSDTKSQATAVAAAACDQKWMQAQIAANKIEDDKKVASEKAQRTAAEAARSNAEADRDAAWAQSLALENQLSAMKDDPYVWPPAIVKELSK